MDRTDVLRVYDNEEFASAYNERFLMAAWPKHGAEFEVSLLEDLLGEGDSWLDLGCGTGWFLSQFPDVDRAGLDLTPAMLAVAEQANPSARFFRQGDFTQDIEEFHGAWSLVSCMWMAYCYLESMPEVEALVANMVRWTATGGTVFIPSVIDLEDLRQHLWVDYEEVYADVWGGRIALTGYNWTWEEPNGNVNANMMAVHVGHFVRLLEDHFEKVEVVRYPVFRAGDVSRKAVIATGRRPDGETGSAEIIWHPIPRHPDDIAADEARAEQAEADRAQAEADRGKAEAELAERLALAAADAHNEGLIEGRHEGRAGGWADGHAEGLAQGRAEAREEAEQQRAATLDHELGKLWAEMSALRGDIGGVHQTIAKALPPAPEAEERLSGASTRRLATELSGRLNPLRPSLWRRLARKVQQRR